MPTEVDGVGGKAMPGEVVEKMHIPTPRAVHHAVDEEQRRLMSALRGASGDDLESHGSPSPKSRSETRQLDTATRRARTWNGAVMMSAPQTIARPRYSVSSNGPIAFTVLS